MLEGAYGELAWRFVAAAVMISLALCGVVVALKWITMGRYEPVMKPMWSWWAMRTEAVAVIYAGLAGRMLLEHLRGTPFLPWIWRLLGAKVGRGVFVDMTDITEFDCVSIGDFAALNAGSALADASLRRPGDEGRPGEGGEGRDRRRRLDRAL